jgi:hypothetical protein
MGLNGASTFFVGLLPSVPILDVADMNGDVILGNGRLPSHEPCRISFRTDRRGRSGDNAAHLQCHGDAERYSCRRAV